MVILSVLVGLTIIKSVRDYEHSVIYFKQNTVETFNQAIIIQATKGYYLDDAYVQSIVPSSSDPIAHFNALHTLAVALYEGKKNETDFFPNFAAPITDISQKSLLENLLSQRFRDSVTTTGWLRLTGNNHGTLEVHYVKGTDN